MIVDAVYDLLCPWSLVAKRCFDVAAARVRPPGLAVRWRPYMLYPHLDRGGHDFLAFFRAKYGEGLRVPMWDRIRRVAEPLGIDFAFERIGRGPHSIDAHRIVRLASREVPGREGELYEAVARAFFEEERVVDENLLVERAAAVGVDPDRARAHLRSGEDEGDIFAETDAWRVAGVLSMPHYILDDRREGVTVVTEPSIGAFEHALRAAA